MNIGSACSLGYKYIFTFYSYYFKGIVDTYLPIVATGNATKLIIWMKYHHRSFFSICRTNDESSVCNPGGGDASVNTMDSRAGVIISNKPKAATLPNSWTKILRQV